MNLLNVTWSDSKKSFTEGLAYKADPSSDEAKLKVKFFLPIIPIVEDYGFCILIDDYLYALIDKPRRKYLWGMCLPLFFLNYLFLIILSF